MTDDVPTTPRKPMSPLRRLKIFEDRKGVCCLCEQKIKAGDTWTIEHMRALGLGGEDDDSNCAPAHEACRRIKDKADVASIAKAKRIKAKHFGIRKRSSFPKPPAGTHWDWRRQRRVFDKEAR